MRRAFLLAMLPLAACASVPVAEAPPAPFEAIAFDINTWGLLLDRWKVRADGGVNHVKADGSVFEAHKLETRAFTVDAAAVARLSALADKLPQPLPSREDCRQRATDLPYGTIRLVRSGAEQSASFDVGCRDAPYQAFVGQLRAMDALVTSWAEAHAPVQVEDAPGR